MILCTVLISKAVVMACIQCGFIELMYIAAVHVDFMSMYILDYIEHLPPGASDMQNAESKL